MGCDLIIVGVLWLAVPEYRNVLYCRGKDVVRPGLVSLFAVFIKLRNFATSAIERLSPELKLFVPKM